VSRRASADDRACFARIEQQNRTLEEADVPRSLAEMFDRLEQIRRTLGPLAEPGVNADAEDVIVHKLIAGRAEDLADIEAIRGAKVALDESYIERWAAFRDVLEVWRGMR
jgi:hypothetical protein